MAEYCALPKYRTTFPFRKGRNGAGKWLSGRGVTRCSRSLALREPGRVPQTRVSAYPGGRRVCPVTDHSRLHIGFEANLGYMIPASKQMTSKQGLGVYQEGRAKDQDPRCKTPSDSMCGTKI